MTPGSQHVGEGVDSARERGGERERGGREERFTVDGTPVVEARFAAGLLRLVEGEPGHVYVRIDGSDAAALRVEQRGSAIVLEPLRGEAGRWRSYDVTVTVPAGSGLRARLATAELAAEVLLGEVEVDTASGQIRLGDVAGDTRLKSASGDVRLGALRGSLRLSTASGDVDVDAIGGDAKLHTAAGDIRVGAARGDLAVKTASGDLRVGSYEGADLSCLSMSGDVTVGLPPGRRLEVDLETLSGTIRNDFEVGHGRGTLPTQPASVRARSISGDVALLRVHAR